MIKKVVLISLTSIIFSLSLEASLAHLPENSAYRIASIARLMQDELVKCAALDDNDKSHLNTMLDEISHSYSELAWQISIATRVTDEVKWASMEAEMALFNFKQSYAVLNPITSINVLLQNAIDFNEQLASRMENFLD